MKVNNPNKEMSRRNLELIIKDIDLRRNISVWDVLEEHNNKYNEKLSIIYDSNTFEPILKQTYE